MRAATAQLQQQPKTCSHDDIGNSPHHRACEILAESAHHRRPSAMTLAAIMYQMSRTVPVI
ncbi:hypothetical protein XVE_1548 [Xanthomonas vesicatoria ATCC 35937]|uniref:Uncharacterized protein n=1 Tax=Xanthomonas vesicatoria ATCC 35937 TaxID=925775 RepID=F0BBS5_9XANT|nr:hypothetical protein XVE_4785 [Xanthomonas vesicatoria ATCC 35937]EGD10123.1 hypothetical protein XVE_1548 [Xanthomonas vesicatoria ATCC 35937]